MAVTLGSVLISGANRGIGVEMVRQLAPNEKNRIFAGCRNPSEAKQLKELADKHKNITVVKLDVVNDDDIKEAVRVVGSNVGHLNVLFNNAGIYEGGSSLADQTRENLIKHFNVNTISPVMMAQAFRDLLVKGKAAHESKKPSVIVNITSEMGSIINASTGSYPYRLSKTALNMVSKCIGNELANQGIYCISMHPGWTQTDMGGDGAPVPVVTSVTGILKVASEVTAEMNSKFLDYMGKYRQY